MLLQDVQLTPPRLTKEVKITSCYMARSAAMDCLARTGRCLRDRPGYTGSTIVLAFAHQGRFAQSAILVSTHADVCALVFALADGMCQSFLDHCSICAAHV